MYIKKIKQKICQAEDINNLINQRTNTPTYFISIIPRQIKRIVVIIYFLFFFCFKLQLENGQNLKKFKILS